MIDWIKLEDEKPQIGLGVLVLTLDVDQFRDPILQQLSSALGRPVQASDLSLSLVPLSLTLNDVEVAERSGFEGDHIITLRGVRTGLFRSMGPRRPSPLKGMPSPSLPVIWNEKGLVVLKSVMSASKISSRNGSVSGLSTTSAASRICQSFTRGPDPPAGDSAPVDSVVGVPRSEKFHRPSRFSLK